MAPKKKEVTPPAGFDLDKLIGEVKKTMGGDLKELDDVKGWTPTDIPQLDIALGGGFPKGMLTTMIGDKSVGKSTLTLHLMAQAQREGGIAVGLDAEKSNLKSRAEAIGIDMKRYIGAQPNSLDTYETEDIDDPKKKVKVKGAFDIMGDLIRTIRRSSRDVDVTIVLDSVAGSSVASEMEGDVGGATMGKHARILSQAFRKYMGTINEMGITFVLVNQLKNAIGVLYGNPKTYIGKNPIDFHSAITIEMTSGGYYPPKCKGEDAVGIITRAFISKNKVAPPFARVSWTTWFSCGIDVLFEQVEFLSAGGHLGGSPGWIEWAGKKIRKSELHELAKSDPAVADRIKNITRAIVKDEIGKRKGVPSPETELAVEA
jgi:recombination protein RecA